MVRLLRGSGDDVDDASIPVLAIIPASYQACPDLVVVVLRLPICGAFCPLRPSDQQASPDAVTAGWPR